MPHLQTGIEWLDRLHLTGPVPRKTRNLTVTVDGEDRDATWKQGVGVHVAGHDFGKGDSVLIKGRLHEVTKMRWMMMEDKRQCGLLR